MTEKPRIAVYHRKPAEPGPLLNEQQQAAAVWDAAEVAGWDIVSVDGAQLDAEPPRQ